MLRAIAAKTGKIAEVAVGVLTPRILSFAGFGAASD
jgi:hypothetical protein